MRYLHRIKMPTMIVWGDEDKIIPVQQADTWRKLVPHADIKIYKGAGHLVHLEKPEAVGRDREVFELKTLRVIPDAAKRRSGIQGLAQTIPLNSGFALSRALE